jgi:hypothetical protein
VSVVESSLKVNLLCKCPVIPSLYTAIFVVRCRILVASKGIGIAEEEMKNESRKCIKGD